MHLVARSPRYCRHRFERLGTAWHNKIPVFLALCNCFLPLCIVRFIIDYAIFKVHSVDVLSSRLHAMWLPCAVFGSTCQELAVLHVSQLVKVPTQSRAMHHLASFMYKWNC